MAEGQANGKPLEILVVEDDNSVGVFLKELIESFGIKEPFGIKVTTAVNEKTGIDEYVFRFYEGKPYDAVLTDLRMPKTGGEKVVEAVKSLSPQTPVVLMSGCDLDDVRQLLADRIGELKPNGYVQKPLDAKILEYFIGWVKLVKANPENPPEFKAPIRAYGYY